MSSLIPIERVEQKILLIRGEKVLLDSDLAELYGVETGALNRAVKRNLERFPEDFAFQLTEQEYEGLRCHFGISKEKGGRRYLPYVVTEQGVAMLSSVLRSYRAIMVNVAIMRTFVKLRRMIISNNVPLDFSPIDNFLQCCLGICNLELLWFYVSKIKRYGGERIPR